MGACLLAIVADDAFESAARGHALGHVFRRDPIGGAILVATVAFLAFRDRLHGPETHQIERAENGPYRAKHFAEGAAAGHGQQQYDGEHAQFDPGARVQSSDSRAGNVRQGDFDGGRGAITAERENGGFAKECREQEHK